MPERDPWLSPKSKKEFEGQQRRILFETVMWDVDSGEITLDMAIAIMSLSDEVLDPTYDDGQDTLFELGNNDGLA